MNACQRPGCAGHYAPDGYCDECGHKAPAGLMVTAASVPSVASVRTESWPLSGASRGSRSGRRGGPGAHLVALAPVPLRDPASAVLANPTVSESHRTCGTCGEPVGQSVDGKPGRAEGFCPRDRTPFSFVPVLKAGDLVGGRYEILGCIAHGGLGWIYLARDRNISADGADRWVVLKGLISTGDADAMAAAVAERRFLVEVDHPNIVKIHDFTTHVNPKSGEDTGYIVMEYVGGRSLKDLALNHRGPGGGRAPLPLPQVLAYAVDILPALGYLHDRDLLFCDFKPDNVIHAEEQLKLIDLGAVRRVGDQESALYGTPGYQAPELATDGPSIESDIYTVGRTLAVLSFEFSGFTSRFATTLPDTSAVPLLAAEESYHRLLRRATHTNAGQRFHSAAEMSDQTIGVLREVLSAADGQPRPATSVTFTPERRTFGASTDTALTGLAVAAALPVPLVDPADPGAPFLAALSTVDPATTIGALEANAGTGSVEVRFRLIHALVENGSIAQAFDLLKAVGKDLHDDWRVHWYGGIVAIAAGDAPAAEREFGAVYDALPGEIAPRLALAAANELAGDLDSATRRYERVWRVDHAYPSAGFGLARMRLAAKDRSGAIAILDQIPDSSSQHTAARIGALRACVDSTIGTLAERDLVDASTRLERLRLDTAAQAELTAELLSAALAWIEDAPTSSGAEGSGVTGSGAEGSGPTGSGPASGGRKSSGPRSSARLLGRSMTERDLRFGLERAYRQLATLATDRRSRYALIDRANSVRPRTMI